MILTSSYVDPDLDGVACAMAYAELLNKAGRPATPGFFGTPHREARFVLEELSLPAITSLKESKDFDQIILLDCGWLSSELEQFISADKVVEVIDHHDDRREHVFKNAKIQIEMVGAAATLVAEKFRDGNIAMSRESAILLYAAIFSNTLNFKSAVATERDRNMADWLSSLTEMPPDLISKMFHVKSDLMGPLLAETLHNDFAKWPDAKMGIAQLEIFGTEELLAARESEILAELEKLMVSRSLDYVFLDLLDIERGTTILVTNHEATKKILQDITGAVFQEHVARIGKLIMRKEMRIPVLDKLNIK